MQLIPRDEKFYDLFREQAENIHKAAGMLKELFDDFRDVETRRREASGAGEAASTPFPQSAGSASNVSGGVAKNRKG